MHIILGFLGMVVTILVLANRLTDAGIDLTWLNPFSWFRRRTWRKKYEGNPIFILESPLEVAAILATAVAKIDGDVSSEEKALLLSLFQSEFGRTEKEASDLLMSSIYLFGDGEDAISKPEKIMQRSLSNFSEDQARSVMSLLESIKNVNTTNLDAKSKFIQKVYKKFDGRFEVTKNW